ncbi:prolactin-inducible protein [Nycticebus coucang]|uniref:prolactin-inducible protein n=1 Tax=Nycticebus coucang TaxID=9470 RepID=UPI00234C294B|nr:prolactin-inducible protein [Nycticebus coucang]
MRSLQLLLRAGVATLLLVLCLHLEISKAQEYTPKKPLMMSMEINKSKDTDNEILLNVTIKTELNECMVVKTYLGSNVSMEGEFTYRYTYCLCKDAPKNLYWQFEVKGPMKIVAVSDITREPGICPNEDAVIPIKANRYFIYDTLEVQ